MASSIPLERDSLIRYFRMVRDRAGELPEFLSPLFAGRDEELAKLHEIVKDASDGALVNRTTVVYGAPGAGKSELKAQFLSQLSAQHGSQIVPVSSFVPAIGDAVILMRSFLSHLSDDLKNLAAVHELLTEVRRVKSFSALGFSYVRGEREQQPESTIQNAQFAWFGNQAEKLPSQVKESVFVLCVDEFQNLRSAEDSLCTFLHENSLGLKIVPIYFGLSDVPDMLRIAGVSRMSGGSSLSIGSLKAEDATAILRVFCNAMEIEFPSRAHRDRITAGVATQCDFWPHHLASWMRAACDVLPTHGFTMTAGALDKTNEICTQYRQEYYSDRVRGPSALSSDTAAQAFGDLLHNRTFVSEDEINLALKPVLERVQREFDINMFVEEAIHSGILERVGMGRYRVPIPSLADYIYEESRPVV